MKRSYARPEVASEATHKEKQKAKGRSRKGIDYRVDIDIRTLAISPDPDLVLCEQKPREKAKKTQ